MHDNSSQRSVTTKVICHFRSIFRFLTVFNAYRMLIYFLFFISLSVLNVEIWQRRFKVIFIFMAWSKDKILNLGFCLSKILKLTLCHCSTKVQLYCQSTSPTKCYPCFVSVVKCSSDVWFQSRWLSSPLGSACGQTIWLSWYTTHCQKVSVPVVKLFDSADIPLIRRYLIASSILSDLKRIWHFFLICLMKC